MTDPRHDEESDLFAAEYVIGLLDGAEARDALRRVAIDPEFAAAVAWWEARLAPLLDEIGEVAPSPAMRARILGAVSDARRDAGNVVAFDRAARRWRAYAIGMTAIAASLAIAIGYEATRQVPAPVVVPQPAPVSVLIATLSSEEGATSLSVAYDGQRGLLVSPGRLAGVTDRDHQLWIIPTGGTPVSLGLIRPGGPLHLPVSAEVARHFAAEATIAVSVEPSGGSPTGQPTGPVIAAGPLVTV